MMQQADRQRLTHIYEYCVSIEKAIQRFGSDFQSFDCDEDFQSNTWINCNQNHSVEKHIVRLEKSSPDDAAPCGKYIPVFRITEKSQMFNCSSQKAFNAGISVVTVSQIIRRSILP